MVALSLAIVLGMIAYVSVFHPRGYERPVLR